MQLCTPTSLVVQMRRTVIKKDIWMRVEQWNPACQGILV
jgi:hypothetical protein